ncbi:hypothetical protein BDZ89DRAFT_1059278 [Hymenopellis radicata]|nr:hypothetical protein BDZ89DRAFT_1059278 [Hymenopellis radicata]
MNGKSTRLIKRFQSRARRKPRVLEIVGRVRYAALSNEDASYDRWYKVKWRC